ncbi:MAG: hypothetical protein K2J79_02800, partial [Ruminiclostridium sp.]|nr:hypothetical protein [Ruminiclostridium sp.]
ALILIIFIVMTITNFSVLTLVSAQNELREVKKSSEIASSYYNAEKEAAVKLNEIKTALNNVTDNAEISSIVSEKGASAKTTPDGVEISFKVSIDENRSLLTVVNYQNNTFDVISQKIVSEKQIIIDDNLDIWDGVSPLV